MGLVDILNKAPVKVASTLVEKTGVSKYTYAQICNFASGIPSTWLTLDAYNNNDFSGVIIGGTLIVLNTLSVYYNSLRNQMAPKYIEEKLEKIGAVHGNFERLEREKLLKENLEIAKFGETNVIPKFGLLSSVGGVAAAMISGLVYSQPDLTEGLYQTGFYALLSSPALILWGMSSYFQAVQKK